MMSMMSILTSLSLSLFLSLSTSCSFYSYLPRFPSPSPCLHYAHCTLIIILITFTETVSMADEGADEISVGSDISGSVVEGHQLQSPNRANVDDIDDEATIATVNSNDSDGSPVGSGPASVTNVSITRKSRGNEGDANGMALEPSTSLELESPLKSMRLIKAEEVGLSGVGSKGSRSSDQKKKIDR